MTPEQCCHRTLHGIINHIKELTEFSKSERAFALAGLDIEIAKLEFEVIRRLQENLRKLEGNNGDSIQDQGGEGPRP